MSDAAQGAAIVVAGAAVVLDTALVAGLGAIAVLGLFQGWASRRPPPVAAVLGAQQVVVGLTVVLITARGVVAA